MSILKRTFGRVTWHRLLPTVMRHFYCLAGVQLLKFFLKQKCQGGKNKTKGWAFKVINCKGLHSLNV